MENTTRLLRRRQVEAATGIRRATIYERMARGQFPRPIHLGPRTVAWLSNEIDGWIAARIAESRTGKSEAQP